jgi:myosin-5
VYNPSCASRAAAPAGAGDWARVQLALDVALPAGSEFAGARVLVVRETPAGESGVLDVRFSHPRLVVVRPAAESAAAASLALPVNPPAKAEELSDLTSLPHLHPPSLISSLSYRFSHELIYTLAGTGITISINPCKPLPELYSSDRIESYASLSSRAADPKPFSASPPHVYKVAAAAASSLLSSLASQSVLVSGESGSGKTVATRYLLRYLSETTRSGGGAAQIQDRVTSSNPILEAFGNARTLRNHNSSRFGKFITLSFGVDQGGGRLEMRHGVVAT